MDEFCELIDEISMQYMDQMINSSDSIKLLGVHLDKHLNLKDFVNRKCRSGMWNLQKLKSIRNRLLQLNIVWHLWLCIGQNAFTKNSTFARSFSVAGPRLWNSIPDDLNCCESTDTFKSKLKTFLFKRYYKDDKNDYYWKYITI